MPHLLTIGGLPGSGKSTLASKETDNGRLAYVFEADDYFTNTQSGIYTFDASKIGQAHAQCQTNVAQAMRFNHPLIVVANTFSQPWERTVYHLLAAAYGYSIAHIDLFDAGLTDEELAARCVHGVPVEQIARMRARWER